MVKKKNNVPCRYTCIGCKAVLEVEPDTLLLPGGAYREPPNPWITTILSDLRSESSGVQIQLKYFYCSEQCMEKYDPVEAHVYPPGLVYDGVHDEVDRFLNRMDTLITKAKFPTHSQALASMRRRPARPASLCKKRQ